MTTYARRLGLFSATMAVIGGIIGGGIFRTPAAVAERTGSASLALATWGVGGVIALIGAVCFGELGARKPKAGGSYVYLRDAFGPGAAFLNAWAQLLIMLPGGTAAVAVVFAGYAVPLLGLSPAATVPLAVGAIVFVAGVNYLGVTPAAVMQNVFVILKLAALAILIVVGLTFAVPYRPLPSPTVSVGSGIVVALGAALVPVLFTYGGWQNTNLIAEEIIAPERNLPRALVLGVLGVVVVYLLANITYLRLLTAPGLAASTAPAADAMRAAWGPRGADLIGAGIAVSAFGFLNLNTLVAPRMVQAMAQDGLLIRRLGELHPRHRTPGAAILVFSAWTIVLTVSGTFNQLVDYVVFGDWIFFGLAVATLFVYRRRDRQAGITATGFHVPGYPVLPAVFVFAALYVVASSIGANPRNAAIGTVLLLLGVPVYLLRKSVRTPGRPDA